jgi:membrane-associated phospholipid phosphatase
MTELGAGFARHDAGSLSCAPPTGTSRLAAALSFLTIGACCAALMQLDVPLLRFFRSLDLSSVERLGNLGEKIGNGATLVAVSLCLLAVGWLAGRKQWMQVGTKSLLAHGCVGLVVNGLKHLIARPRPRLTHSGGWQWWPSFESGLDSFPSGHASATFAVATVLARYWPRTAWIGYSLATWVAMSRVWRGSHFATDVVAGMVAGVVVGTVFAGPLRQWRTALMQAMVRVTPIAVMITSALWLILRRVDHVWMDRLLSIGGICFIAAGLLVRFRMDRAPEAAWSPVAYRAGTILIGFGLACTTGSLVLVGLAGLAASAWWLQAAALHGASSRAPSLRTLHVLGIALAALLILQLKGIVPIQ